MKNLVFLFLKAFFIFLSVCLYAQEDKGIVAKIEKNVIEKQLLVKAAVTNNSSIYRELNYLLVAIKKGSSGNLSNNKQSGKFSINPGETKSLSELSVNLDKNDALKAYLYIRDEENQKLISKDSLEINQNFLKNKIAKVESDVVFELRGLTIDETKTKVGKDFYDQFYIQYNQLPEKSSSAIKIIELPTRGTSGQITIEIDDKMIYGFVTNPSEEFITEQVFNALRYIKEFTASKNLVKNEFIY
ncbi:CsgE family curli-type amyloid fiber assembly protein [Chryseobacterium sp. GP-SGM7]|uniref:CsgE family curli-type amyloid fiber assembly protein n=1 Tax=Chryseobacterium sp. GP-SGM7 TaxID=3411323 RepID=UPI003B95FEF5